MRRALLQMTPELLQELLRFPIGSEIDGAEWDAKTRCVIFSVRSDQFPDVRREEHAPFVTYDVRSEWNL